ncbi:MAG: c-type cytochrome [Anaerolineae bacterium]|nr:c-type cytochrome [Anaerolineae bacterium]
MILLRTIGTLHFQQSIFFTHYRGVNVKRTSVFCVLLLILAACGRNPAEVALVQETAVAIQAATRAAIPTSTPAPDGPAMVGDPAVGQALFNTAQTTSSGVWMCSQCHAIDSSRLIGPGLGGLRDRAATRVVGQSAEEYVHTSIVDPQAFVVQGDPPYPENLMPQDFAQLFSEEELNDLVAYVLTLP